MSSEESDYAEDQQDLEEEGDIGVEGSEDDSDDNLIDKDDSDEDDGLQANAWGKNKTQFYNEDEGKQSDDEAEFEEEEEVKIIEGLRKEKLTEGEFFDSILDSRKSKIQVSTEDQLEDEGEDGTGPFDAKRMDQIRKLDDFEKFELIKKESPELIGIVNELSKNLKQIKYKYLPLLNYVRGQGMASIQGKKYIETKFELLLSYCINLAFYISLKKEGKSVKDHQILKRLMATKTQMAKMKEVDKVVEKQTDQLLRKVVSSQRVTSVSTHDMSQIEQVSVKKRKSINQFKTSLETNENLETKTLKQKLGVSQGKKSKASKRLQKKVQKEAAESSQDDPLELVDSDEDEKARLSFGSNKLSALKQKKNNPKVHVKGVDEDLDFDDLDDIKLDGGGEDDEYNENFNESELQYGAQPKKTKTVADFLKKKKYQQMSREEDNEMKPSRRAEGDVYRQLKKVKREKKEKLQQKQQEEHSKKFEHDNKKIADENGVRAITNTILRNKGLTRRRKKEDKNSRVKLRNKYDKALKKIKDKGNYLRDQSRGYEGEATGIKSGIIRSTHLYS